jgi:hypothetical protein
MKLTKDEILKQIDADIEKPFVTAYFGNNWREHAKENYDIDAIINIAWKQGRRAILLEKIIEQILKSLATNGLSLTDQGLSPRSQENDKQEGK